MLAVTVSENRKLSSKHHRPTWERSESNVTSRTSTPSDAH